MGSMTENIADKAINDTRIVKQFTNPVKEPIDSDRVSNVGVGVVAGIGWF